MHRAGCGHVLTLSMRFHNLLTSSSCSCSKVFSRSIFSRRSYKEESECVMRGEEEGGGGCHERRGYERIGYWSIKTSSFKAHELETVSSCSAQNKVNHKQSHCQPHPP